MQLKFICFFWIGHQNKAGLWRALYSFFWRGRKGVPPKKAMTQYGEFCNLPQASLRAVPYRAVVCLEETDPEEMWNLPKKEPPDDALDCPFSHTCFTFLWPPGTLFSTGHSCFLISCICIMSPQPDASSFEIRKNIWFLFPPPSTKCSTEQIEGPQQYIYWSSAGNSGEKHCSTAISLWPSASEHQTEFYLPVKIFFFPINCPSKLRFFPQHSLLLLVLQTCIDMKLALNVLGKYPWIPKDLKFPLVYGWKWSL